MAKIAKDGGYSLILERKSMGLIYADDSVDITDQVVKAYDSSKK